MISSFRQFFSLFTWQGLQWLVFFWYQTSLSRAEVPRPDRWKVPRGWLILKNSECRSLLTGGVWVAFTPFCIILSYLSSSHIPRNSWLWWIQAKLRCPEADNFYRRLNRRTVLEALTHFCLLLLQGLLSICWYQQLQCNECFLILRSLVFQFQ